MNHPHRKSLIKVNFRCAEKDKSEIMGAKCVIHISVGQEYHEGEKFAATLELINSTFRKCTIMLCDSLQRHTMSFTNKQATQEELYQMSMDKGDEWLLRNSSIINRLLKIPHNIIRWDYWLQHPEYNTKRALIEKLYFQDEVYRQAYKRTIDKFLCRLGKKAQIKEEEYARFAAICLEYLKEECAIIIPLWAVDNYGFVIYPRKRTDAMEMTYERLLKFKNPKLLREVALKFNKRSDDSPFVENLLIEKS